MKSSPDAAKIRSIDPKLARQDAKNFVRNYCFPTSPKLGNHRTCWNHLKCQSRDLEFKFLSLNFRTFKASIVGGLVYNFRIAEASTDYRLEK